MDDKDLEGELVYLTVHYDRWLRDVDANFNIPMANRLARVIKVFDWDTDEGKLLLAAREKTGKWNNLNPKDFKFVLQIYYPELKIKEKNGFTSEEVVSRKYPGTELYMFNLVPGWMIKSFKSSYYQKFTLKSKADEQSDTGAQSKKKVAKKKTVRRKKVRKL